MKQINNILLILFALLFGNASYGANVTLAWDASPSSVNGYRIYYGANSSAYTNSIDVGNTLATTVSNLSVSFTYYFAATAYDGGGIESLPSNEVMYYIPDTTPTNSIPVYTNGGTPPTLTLSVYYLTNSTIFTNFTLKSDMLIPQSWSVLRSTNLLNWANFANGSNSVVNLNVSNDLRMAFFRLAINIPITPTNTITNTYVLGNTNNGTLIDTLFSTVPYINANRFLSLSNVTVTTISARLPGGSGRYKFAVYSNSGSLPANLLAQSLEVTNPPNGWITIPLTQSLNIVSNSNYWLAIWSDASDASIYYSNGTNPLRWQGLTYGDWPSVLNTTGGGQMVYCIFAR